MTTTESMVKNLINTFEKDGLQVIQANCSGFENPTEVEGVEPDVIWWNPHKELYHVGVVADSQSISSDLIKQKILTLSKLMMGKGSSEGERLPFVIGVPPEASNVVDKTLSENNISSQGNTQKIIL
ncbi:hypothetical protein AAA799E16_01920 [Marine Group I thaumarchaeote SCGC AAA799-E16]|uniref:Uncharacterized protein n=4 Tax=Marine Group I TaxID=905826 RepID=A0A081RMV6_9ARCH|nr:hypothetical protein AAA799N04_01021 [Marine Group I thaumarchaeote SCGC AAA799-N04]KER05438.1 hypothetical protein AAA799E16_01920 [Marine Group I thaumarchaeote SCGC AAA799-E16]KFM15582.1 hypothetical protein AAA799D11_01187 [Marine Group I thaumarchaeote SCGC AAA799-D11]KFM16782.1 hypothetical protein SCCGRSA3_02099 [Marine Group I thaumarchaeote SCGC RSA3]